ncbi:MAG: Stp1/IreP family PP2C-type Ser/Thr phosphatase [Elusimicrobia bacterium]|nr:Stp1/IreP family PP2C-type Ser/Thr phosphatase [Elusimicrobiota bacterium]
MSFKISFCGKSEIGKVRKNNEDSIFIDNDLSLAVVADGMGGHKSGEIASSMAVKIIAEKYAQLTEAQMKPSPYYEKYSVQTNRLIFSVNIANAMIYETSKAKEENKGMGTTVTACACCDGILSLVHIGDSRAYLIRENSIFQLSSDHSLVMEQVRKGIITKEQAETSPLQNVLLKALGTQSLIEPEISETEIKEGDKILLCSDGLFKCVKEEDILSAVKAKNNCEEAVKILIKESYEAGAPDNVTIALGTAEKIEFKEKLKMLLRKIGI